MFSWFRKRSNAFMAMRKAAPAEPDSNLTARASIRGGGRALTLVEVGRSMLRIKASDPEITDLELALRFDKSTDYVYTAIEAARRSYLASRPEDSSQR